MAKNSKWFTRRDFLRFTTMAAGTALYTGCKQRAGKSNDLLIGITSDASGMYAAAGQMDRYGMKMAIDEFNAKGGVLGRNITTKHIDTETKAEAGSRVASTLIDQHNAVFLIGAVSSGVANAISSVAQEAGCIYLNTNSSSPSETRENCHRTKFVWDANGANFNHALVKNVISKYGKEWLFMTNDYKWGHDTAKGARELLEAAGGKVTQEIMVEPGTKQFSSILLKVQQAKPKVVNATIGGEDLQSLQKAVKNMQLDKDIAWTNNQLDWPDAYGRPANEIFGVFGTTWYYDLDLPGVKEFVQRYQTAFPKSKTKVPGNCFYNGYMATKELLSAVERVGSTNNIKIIKELEKLKVSAKDRMQHHDAYMDASNHHMNQTVYLCGANLESKDKNNIFKVISNAAPADVKDKDAGKGSKMESYKETTLREV
jgi:branched-chain amino acid transport system substrate-binding protein